MSLIACKECDSEISDRARSCPSCGAPQGQLLGQVDTVRLFWAGVCAVGFFLPFFSLGGNTASGWEILKAIYTAIASDQAPVLWDFISRTLKHDTVAGALFLFIVIGPVGFGFYAVSHIVHSLNPSIGDKVGGSALAGSYVLALVIAAIKFDIKVGDMFSQNIGVGAYVSIVALCAAAAIEDDEAEEE